MQSRSHAKRPAIDLAELRTIADLQQDLSNIFRSRGSIDWELRVNRRRYQKAGALFEIAGRLMAHPETFKRVALAIAAERVGV